MVLWLGRSIATQVRGLRRGDRGAEGEVTIVPWSIGSDRTRWGELCRPLKNLNITKIPITIDHLPFIFWRHNLVLNTINGVWCSDCCTRGQMPITSDFLWSTTLTDGDGRDSAMHFLLESKMHKIPPLRWMGYGDTYLLMWCKRLLFLWEKKGCYRVKRYRGGCYREKCTNYQPFKLMVHGNTYLQSSSLLRLSSAWT